MSETMKTVQHNGQVIISTYVEMSEITCHARIDMPVILKISQF